MKVSDQKRKWLLKGISLMAVFLVIISCGEEKAEKPSKESGTKEGYPITKSQEEYPVSLDEEVIIDQEDPLYDIEIIPSGPAGGVGDSGTPTAIAEEDLERAIRALEEELK